MKNSITQIWNSILKQTAEMMEKDKTIIMYRDARSVFEKNFNYYYEMVRSNFMKIQEENLDRHKIAAVTICAILKSDILGPSGGEDNSQKSGDMFLANEKIALNIALSDMYQSLVEEYDSGRIPYVDLIFEYILPKPLSCDRDYTEVICRDLYYAKKHFALNPLSISNFLFLLEAYSFEVNRIPIDKEKWIMIQNERRKTQIEKELKQVEKQLKVFDKQKDEQRKELEHRRSCLNEKRKDIER